MCETTPFLQTPYLQQPVFTTSTFTATPAIQPQNVQLQISTTTIFTTMKIYDPPPAWIVGVQSSIDIFSSICWYKAQPSKRRPGTIENDLRFKDWYKQWDVRRIVLKKVP